MTFSASKKGSLMKRRFIFRAIRATALCLLLSMLFMSCSAAAARGEGKESGGEDMPVSGDVRPKVALTYDDGPHPTRTKQIVDELDKYGFHATFFVVGNRVDGTEMDCSDAMLYAMKSGNEIGIHGYTHASGVYYDTCSDDVYDYEINNTKSAIRGVKTGYKIKHMRPFGGEITEERVEESPYSVILWDVDSEDWKLKYAPGDTDEVCENKVNRIVDNVLSSVREGSIILMHDLYESTYDATVIILRELDEMGFDVVTVSELLGEDREAGKLYLRGE